MCLLGAAPFLKALAPSFLVLHMDFCIVLPSYDSNCQQPSSSHDVNERNGMWPNNKTVNHLKLVVHMVSPQMPAITAFPLYMSSISRCSAPEFPMEPGAAQHMLGGLKNVAPTLPNPSTQPPFPPTAMMPSFPLYVPGIRLIGVENTQQM